MQCGLSSHVPIREREYGMGMGTWVMFYNVGMYNVNVHKSGMSTFLERGAWPCSTFPAAKSVVPYGS